MNCFVFQNAIWFPLECEPTYWQLASEPAFRNIGLLIVAIVGLGFAAYRSYHLFHQTKIGQKQSKTSEDGLNIDRFQKGAAMLGDSRLSVREAGIIMLSELARQNMAIFLEPVLKILCTFVRDRSNEQLEIAKNDSVLDPTFKIKIGMDCRAALEELSTINNLQLCASNIASHQLKLRDCNLQFSNLQSFCLENAILWESNLNDTELFDVNFCGADFYGATLKNADFYEADLNGAKNFTYAQLKEAINVDPEFLEKLRLKELSEKETSNPEATPPTIP